MRSLTAVILFIIAAVVMAGTAAAASARFVDLPEDKPVGTGPPQLARFAVLVYNLSYRNAQLKYVNVSDNERHPDKGGMRYQMTLTAAGPTGVTGKYHVVVWGIPKSYQWMLLEFKHVK